VLLRADVQQWEVQWGELQVDRPIGQGSFGWVYLAQWHQTSVACKILTKQGEVPAAAGVPSARCSFRLGWHKHWLKPHYPRL
jgi:serine/threonine protein kinase